MYSKYISSSKILILFSTIVLVFLVGCGGGSSSESISETFSVNLSAGKISYEGSGDKDVLYASITGTQVAGGWIEDQNGIKLAGSDLIKNDLTLAYEAEVYRNSGSFVGGKYVLKYVQNSNTMELIKPNIQWTTAQTFNPSPTIAWSPLTRLLTVRYSPLSGSIVSYYLRIYNSGSMLVRETGKFQGPEVSEYLPLSGNYRVMLIGEVKNGDEIVETVRYFFSEQAFNSI